MSLYKAQEANFYKCLILDNPNRSGLSDTVISNIEQEGLEVYYCTTLLEGENILKKYNIYLLIVNINFMTILMDKILKQYEKSLKIIVMLDNNEHKEMSMILDQLSFLNKQIEIIDYFFIPLDKMLVLYRIKFLLNQQKEFVHITENHLEKYIWEIINYQSNQLHNIIWKKNYNHYLLTKHIQYLSFFFHILSLLNEEYYHKSSEYIIDKTINNIELQMCFFNSYITFKTEGECPMSSSHYLKNFLLFLIFLSELLKINMISTEIILNFFMCDSNQYVEIEMDSTLRPFVERYNLMHANRYHLFHYLQEYLWEHWQKNVTLREKSDKIIVVEVLLQNKK